MPIRQCWDNVRRFECTDKSLRRSVTFPLNLSHSATGRGIAETRRKQMPYLGKFEVFKIFGKSAGETDTAEVH